MSMRSGVGQRGSVRGRDGRLRVRGCKNVEG
jgi:hypothetical protein